MICLQLEKSGRDREADRTKNRETSESIKRDYERSLRERDDALDAARKSLRAEFEKVRFTRLLPPPPAPPPPPPRVACIAFDAHHSFVCTCVYELSRMQATTKQLASAKPMRLEPSRSGFRHRRSSWNRRSLHSQRNWQ